MSDASLRHSCPGLGFRVLFEIEVKAEPEEIAVEVSDAVSEEV